MASSIKWGTLSGSNSITITLNSVTSGSFTSPSTAFDNSTALNRWGWVEIVLGSITATAAANLVIYIVNSLDGTNFDEGASSTNPAAHEIVQTLSLAVSGGAATHRVMSTQPFPLPPTKFKFVVKNNTGVTLASSGNSMNLYTDNEAVG